MHNRSIQLKIYIKRILLRILTLGGYLSLMPIWRLRRGGGIIILRYHSISDYRRHEVNVTLKAFLEQMEFLAKHYNPISLSQAIDKRNLPKNSVVVTFDDGYKDNFTNAFLILKRFKIPAAIFLPAAYIGTDTILPCDLKDDPRYNRLLSWNEVDEMAKSGIEFGSHTMHHANLGKDKTDVAFELLESKKIIEERLKKDVWAISYPFGLAGDFNPNVKRMAQEAGYSCGLSAMNGINGFNPPSRNSPPVRVGMDSEENSASARFSPRRSDTKDSTGVSPWSFNTDLFELKRIGIEASDDIFTFKAKLNGALDILAIKDTPFMNRLRNMTNRLLGV